MPYGSRGELELDGGVRSAECLQTRTQIQVTTNGYGSCPMYKQNRLNVYEFILNQYEIRSNIFVICCNNIYRISAVLLPSFSHHRISPALVPSAAHILPGKEKY